ncbi:MAG: hypothetical protein HFJ50_02225 [Clostridia bacterium]|nr:hypothetical protein [Clostridia bacterium]
MLGVLFVNNAKSEDEKEISSYINEFIDKSKEQENVNYTGIFMTSIKNNVSLAVSLWFAGLTLVGVLVVYGLICYRGFIFGYSVSCIIASLGANKRCSIYTLLNASSKYYIYTSAICTCYKWNKII